MKFVKDPLYLVLSHNILVTIHLLSILIGSLGLEEKPGGGLPLKK